MFFALHLFLKNPLTIFFNTGTHTHNGSSKKPRTHIKDIYPVFNKPKHSYTHKETHTATHNISLLYRTFTTQELSPVCFVITKALLCVCVSLLLQVEVKKLHCNVRTKRRTCSGSFKISIKINLYMYVNKILQIFKS